MSDSECYWLRSIFKNNKTERRARLLAMVKESIACVKKKRRKNLNTLATFGVKVVQQMINFWGFTERKMCFAEMPSVLSDWLIDWRDVDTVCSASLSSFFIRIWRKSNCPRTLRCLQYECNVWDLSLLALASRLINYLNAHWLNR